MLSLLFNFNKFNIFFYLFMQKIDHIGIAVKSLSVSIPIYESMLNTKCYHTEFVEAENVNTAFFKVGESKIELLESTKEDGVIAKFIEKKGEGFHHIAYEVKDIHEAIFKLKKEGFNFINEPPKKGADNKLICFIHPKSTQGILTELCMEII